MFMTVPENPATGGQEYTVFRVLRSGLLVLRSGRNHGIGVAIMSTRIARLVVLCGFLVAGLIAAGGC